MDGLSNSLRPSAIARPASAVRLRAVVGGMLATGAGSALVLILTVKAGASATMILGLVFAVGVVWLFRTRRSARALAAAVAYLGLLDGFLRLETGSSTLTLGRDVVLYAVAVGMLLRAFPNRRTWNWPPFTGWVIGWTGMVLVQLFNPDSGPTLHRIVSLRQDLEFVPLFFMAYALVRTKRQLRALLTLLLVIGAVNGVVGLYQSGLSPAQLSGWGPGYYSMIHGLKDGSPTTAVGADGKAIVRPPALGGDMGFAGAIGIIALPAGLALLLSPGLRPSRRALIGGLVVCTTLGVLTSQSRANLISSIVALVAFAAMLAASRDGRRVVYGLAAMAVLIVIALSFLSKGALHRYDSITPSKLAGTTASSRSGTISLIPIYIVKYPFGGGLGSSGPAFDQYGASLNTLNGETQITFLIGEVGIPGLLLFLVFQLRFLAAATRRVRRVVDDDSRFLLVALMAPLFGFVVNWYVGVNTVSPPNATYMWGAMGILAFWLFSGRRVDPQAHAPAITHPAPIPV